MERLIDVRTQQLPELAARPRGFKKEVVRAVAQGALHPGFPLRPHLRQVMAVLDQFGRKEEAARINVCLCPIAKAPAKVRAEIRHCEKSATETTRLDPIPGRDRPF